MIFFFSISFGRRVVSEENLHPCSMIIFDDLDVSKNRGTLKWMVKIMENPMNKWMIWGGFPPIFGSTPIWKRVVINGDIVKTW